MHGLHEWLRVRECDPFEVRREVRGVRASADNERMERTPEALLKPRQRVDCRKAACPHAQTSLKLLRDVRDRRVVAKELVPALPVLGLSAVQVRDDRDPYG